jgi:hypothetical protein
MSGYLRPDPIPHDTIRMTVEVEVPHEEAIMNNGSIAKQIIRDYINSNEFSSFDISSGPRSVDLTGKTIDR